MEKKVVKINESTIRRIVSETIKNIMKENDENEELVGYDYEIFVDFKTEDSDYISGGYDYPTYSNAYGERIRRVVFGILARNDAEAMNLAKEEIENEYKDDSIENWYEVKVISKEPYKVEDMSEPEYQEYLADPKKWYIEHRLADAYSEPYEK